MDISSLPCFEWNFHVQMGFILKLWFEKRTLWHVLHLDSRKNAAWRCYVTNTLTCVNIHVLKKGISSVLHEMIWKKWSDYSLCCCLPLSNLSFDPKLYDTKHFSVYRQVGKLGYIRILLKCLLVHEASLANNFKIGSDKWIIENNSQTPICGQTASLPVYICVSVTTLVKL